MRIAGEEYRGYAIPRGQRAVAPAALVWDGRIELPQLRRIVKAIAQRPRQTSAGEIFERTVGESPPQAALEAGFDIAHLVQFATADRKTPARIESGRGPGFDEVLGRAYAAADGLMDALDLGHIECPARIAHQQRAGHVQLRQRLPAARGDRACAGCQDLAALEQRSHTRMLLELLEGLEGLQARIVVIEADDEADIHAILIEMIEKAAAIGMALEWPAHTVPNQAGLHASGG